MASRPAIPPLVLASASRPRARIMENAGLAFSIRPASVDEGAMKASMRASGADAAATAEALAATKALQVGPAEPDALVIGADQMLACENVWYDKPPDRETARSHLETLRGKTHQLYSAMAVARGASVIWHHVDVANMTMRPFSDAFMDDYLDRMGEGALATVGGYELEGIGAQLFSRIDGDFFTILGLPLLPLLDFLRGHGVVRT